ncbi:cytochrome P450 9AG7 [Nasonia vitripennis]|uniref:Cytochrome P450 n=1 Tax=Nasonia vitripennis TaxID=7425 RepID=A0A7M6UP79_NASVI|nr:cytochrome P450 9AG7 [Nasonia vitripennis]
MDTWTWSLLVASLGLLYYYFKKKLNYFEELGIPYVPGWPLFGNMASVFFRKSHLNDTVKHIYNAHPEAKYVGFFDFGSRPVIMLRDLDLIKSVAITNADKFPDHLPFVHGSIDPLFGTDLFNTLGDQWRELRSLLTPALTPSKLKGMFPSMIECAQNLVSYIEDLPPNSRKLINTKELFTKSTNDIITTCAYGISVDSLKDPNNAFYVFGNKAANLDGHVGLKIFIMRSLSTASRLLRLKFVSDENCKRFTDLIRTAVKTRDDNGISRPDMLQLMMDARKDTKTVDLDPSLMAAQAFSFFLSNFDSSATHMCLMAHELAINPDIQDKLQNEIDDVLKETQGNLTYEVINGMQYFDAVFNETLRKHAQGTGAIDRVCKASFEFPPALSGGKPVTLKPGANVWIPSVAIHADPQYYEEPDRFDPDRYYKKKVNAKNAPNLGFGIGPRGCLGVRFAVIEVKILFFYLLSKFTLKRTEKTCSPLVYDKRNLFLVAEGGYFLDIEPRN